MSSPSEKRNQNIVIALIIFTLVGGIFYYYKYHVKWAEREINLGYSQEALRNPFLAAHNFLDKFGIDSERTIKFTLLDSLNEQAYSDENLQITNQDTLVLVNSRGIINGRRYENLWRWVEDGGTLITSVQNPFIGALQREDKLFQELGIYLELSEDEEDEDFVESFDDVIDKLEETVEEAANQDNDNIFDHSENDDGEYDSDNEDSSESEAEESFVFSDLTRCEDVYFRELTFPSDRQTVELGLVDESIFYFDYYYPDWAVSYDTDESRALAASFTIGAGKIVVLSSPSLWTNRYIQCYDNAYFLWSLVNPQGKVWFLENRDAPSLFVLLYRHLPWAVVSLGLLIVLLLWKAFTRFGPLFAPAVESRRSFAEHLRATGTFLWRRSAYNVLVNGLRHSIDASISRKVMGFEKKEREEKLEIIEKLTKIDGQYVSDAMFKEEIETLQEFVEFIKVLKMIKDNL